MSETDVKVLYIAGWGRSGSTILTRVLGQVDGFFAGGELRYLWQRNLVEGHDCGCGKPFRACELWRGALSRPGVGDSPEAVHERLECAAVDRRIPAMLTRSGRRRVIDDLGEAGGRLLELYRGIRDASGCKVVVDSSKVPSYGFLLQQVPGLDVRVIHLVRDPRAVAYSWQRKKMLRNVGRLMIRRGAFESGWRWVVRNLEVDLLWRGSQPGVLRMRYEDFIDRPEASLRRILELVGEENARLPIARPGVVILGESHTSSGNPNRFQTGEIELRRDDEWRTALRPRDRRIVSAVTAPVRRYYGFDGPVAGAAT